MSICYVFFPPSSHAVRHIHGHTARMASEIPGPRPWPLVGNLPNIDLANSVQSLVDIGKEYGSSISSSKRV